MPYKSAKQRRFMHARHPQIAARWDDKYGGTVAKSSYGSVASGRRILDEDLVEKGIMPVIARVRPAAGRGGRRVMTGDINGPRVVGKAFSLSAFKGLRQPGGMKGTVGGFKSGLSAGRTGATRLASPASAGARMGMSAGRAIGANPMATGAVAGAGLTAGVLGGSGQRESPSIYTPPQPLYTPFGKRSYDPEGERRFRQGAYAAGTGIGALELGRRGYKDIKEATRLTRGIASHKANHGLKGNAAVVSDKAHARRIALLPKGVVVTRGGGSKAAGAVALLGTSGALLRNRHEERWT